MKALLLASAGIFATAGLMYLNGQDNQLAESVRDGTLNLSCEFRDGWRDVEPEKVKGFNDGRWLFVNGSAVNCEVSE